MTKEKTDREEAAKVRIFIWLMLMGVIMFTAVIAQHLHSDEMVHKFKSPSFSGIGTSAHYLTVENQQFNRKQALKAEIKALQDEIERDKENTTLARFIRNLESRIYAQLSKQLDKTVEIETNYESIVSKRKMLRVVLEVFERRLRW